MPEMPNWLVKALRAEKALELFQKACALNRDLFDCIRVARIIAGESGAQVLVEKQEKLVEQSGAYLDSMPGKSLWYKFTQIGKLERLIADLGQQADVLARKALPGLDDFAEHVHSDCQTVAGALLDFHRKGWDIEPGGKALLEIQLRLKAIQCGAAPERATITVLQAYEAHQQARQLLKDVEDLRELDSQNREARKILSQLQSDYPSREYRLTVQQKRLGHFKEVCSSWRDIEPSLDQANELLAQLAAGLTDLETLIEHGEVVSALAMAKELQASFDQLKSLCDRSEKIRTDRRMQLNKAADTVTDQLKRAWKVTQGHGKPEHNQGLQYIREFVGMYRQALKDRGSMLTVAAIVEQAQAIVPAVDALQADSAAVVQVAVQTEFAELGCFPE